MNSCLLNEYLKCRQKMAHIVSLSELKFFYEFIIYISQNGVLIPILDTVLVTPDQIHIFVALYLQFNLIYATCASLLL
jgi:hypothetical protein